MCCNDKKSMKKVFEKLNKAHSQYYQVFNREKKLIELLETIVNERDTIKKAIQSDFKKPFAEIDFTEIVPVVSELRHAISNINKWTKPQKNSRTLVHYNSKVRVIYQPKGVVLIISPWNYPFSLCIGPLISAIAAGNRVIIKPSEFTPNTSAYIKELLSKVFPDDWVYVATGGADVAKELTSLPFNHIFFTGSPNVGKLVMKAASEHLCSVTLELGGKSPCILDENFNAQTFAKRVVWGKFINAGQTCIAPDYLLIPKNRRNECLEFLEKEINERFPGPVDSYTRIINEKHFNRLIEVLEDAKSKGAIIHYGGESDTNELYIKPTIISNITSNMTIHNEEIFGPILPVYTYETKEDCIRDILSKPRPLATYLFTKDKSTMNLYKDNINTGALVVNDVLSHYIHKHLPFGGSNNSGIGRSHGIYGFKAFSNEMAYLETGPGPTGADIIKQPYDNKVKFLIDKAIKYL